MKPLQWTHAIILSLVVLAGGCSEDISSKSDDAQQGEDGSPAGGGSTPPALTEPGPGGAKLRFSMTEGGTFIAEVDATEDAWVYVDIVNQRQVDPPNPQVSDAWHLAHNGSDIKLNGGDSGAPSSGIRNAVYGEKVDEEQAFPFASVVAAPPESTVDYRSDVLGDHDGISLTDEQIIYAMTSYPEADQRYLALIGGDKGWYRESAFGVSETPRENVGYVLRTHDCRYFKLRMLSYSNADGDQGYPRYEFAEIPGGSCSAGGPAGEQRVSFSTQNNVTAAEVDATSEDDWVYIDLQTLSQTYPSAPASDPDGWDVAFKRSDIKINSGASGAGEVGIHDIYQGDWDSINAVPGDADYHRDTDEALAFVTYPEGDGSCSGTATDYGWYHYSYFCDEGNGIHHISPRDVVYIVKDGEQYWKFRVLDYYSDSGDSGQLSVEFAPVAAN
mgnify:CR=1 FL=1